VSRDASLEQLVESYGALIRRVVAGVCGPARDLIGDDVQQEVLVALWKRLKGEQPIERPASYVYRAAVREAVRLLNRERERRAEPIEGLDLPGRYGDGPLANVEARQLRERIERALSGLPADRQRAARAHLAGFDVAEIMEMTDWPYQKARNLVARGMADLRTRLAEQRLQ
jgi:RNA polymerase sigma factor (sigma-70 family)